MKHFALFVLAATAILGSTAPVNEDPAQPCCIGACTAPKAKYYSVDKLHDMCGECCMDPKNYKLYHLFEPGLTKAQTDSPCRLQKSPHQGELNYTVYTSTVTHGAGPIKMTLDLYKPCPDTQRCPPPPNPPVSQV